MNKRKSTYILKKTDLYDEARRRYQELLVIRQRVEDCLVHTPPGKIHIACSGNQTKFYLRREDMSKGEEYISKSDKKKLQQHLQKAYNEKILKLLSREISLLESFIKRSENIVSKIQQKYSNLPAEAKKYINPIAMSDEDYKNAWDSTPYTGKQVSDYVTLYETDRKERVRSKSELNIANALAANGIPYKYECPLVLKNGATVHPDFTVLNVKERKVYYWEHRGMMDDKDYARNAVLKMKMYMNSGIIPGRNLIITEETSTSPLGTNEISNIIAGYFKNLV